VLAANQIDDDPPQVGAGVTMEAAPALVEADEGLLGEIGRGRRVTGQKAGEALEIYALGCKVLMEVGIAPSNLHLVSTTPGGSEKLRVASTS
jgi:hypothetical protein